MKKAVLILIAIICFSCKDETKNKESQIVETPKEVVVKDNTLSIILDVKVKEDDKLELYYVINSPEDGFSRDNRYATYIKGNNEFQKIEFKLPKDVFPYKLRLDLGDNGNKYETNIEIKSITLQLNNNTIEIDHTTMDSFFQPNVYLQKTDNGYSRKVVDGKYDPFLLAKPVLIKKMELEL